MTIREHHYETREALAEALATGVAAVLAGGIATRGQAVLAVSGGSTPKLFFKTLSQADLDWSSVTVCLVDERWVPETSDRSNTRLVRENLLTGRAASAHLEPLFEEGPSAREAEDEVSRRLSALPRPFDAVILGMGNDGHTASFFPGADRLAEAIDPAAGHRTVAIEAPGAGEPRITLACPSSWKRASSPSTSRGRTSATRWRRRWARVRSRTCPSGPSCAPPARNRSKSSGRPERLPSALRPEGVMPWPPTAASKRSPIASASAPSRRASPISTASA